MLTGPRTRHRVAFSNPEFVLEARRNEGLRDYLNSCDLNLIDGVGVVYALRFVRGITPPARFTGTDFSVTMVGEECATAGARLFLFGGRPGVAARAADVLRARYPGIEVCGTLDGYAEADGALERMREAAPDVVIVCLGNPRQEAWIEDHAGGLDVRLVYGAGGALDFLAGDVPRAPRWMQRAGLEWLFRLVTNFSVARLKRQLELAEFVWLVMRARRWRGSSRAS